MRIFIGALFVLLLANCSGEPLEVQNSSFSQSCREGAAVKKLENSEWRMANDNMVMTVYFGEQIVEIQYSCVMQTSSARYTSQPVTDSSEYFYNEQSIRLDQNLYLNARIPQLDKACHYFVSERMPYELYGSCLKLVVGNETLVLESVR